AWPVGRPRPCGLRGLALGGGHAARRERTVAEARAQIVAEVVRRSPAEVVTAGALTRLAGNHALVTAREAFHLPFHCRKYRTAPALVCPSCEGQPRIPLKVPESPKDEARQSRASPVARSDAPTRCEQFVPAAELDARAPVRLAGGALERVDRLP